MKLIYFYLLFKSIFGSVILSGGPYCSTDGGSVQHAVPGTVISITCAVDNPSPGANVLLWYIPSYGVSVSNVNGQYDTDDDQPDFRSTVNSANNTVDTTNATLTFTAVSELDGAVVNCADVTETTSSCTLYILTPPSQPLIVTCFNVTYNSITLVWSPPADNGGETVSHYNITRISGGRTLLSSTRSIVETNLEPKTNYSFLITASNSQGVSNSSTQTCLTPGEVFNSIPEVNICLDSNETAYLSIMFTQDCPPSSPNISTTPPFDNFTITVSGFDPVYTNSCVFNQPINAEKEYNITITVNNQVGPSEPITKHFDSRWMKNINHDVGVLSYSLVNCTTVKDASVTLFIAESDNRAASVLRNEQPYSHNYTIFNIDSLSPSTSYIYTLLVIRPTNITLASYTGVLMTSNDSSKSNSMGAIVGGAVVVAAVFILLVIGIILPVVCCLQKKKNSKPANYQDPNTIERKEAQTTGDLYAMPDKSKRRPPPAGPEPATYQDPNTIQREKAPTGDMYALPEKKPLYSTVNEDRKGSLMLDPEVYLSPALSSSPSFLYKQILYSHIRNHS